MSKEVQYIKVSPPGTLYIKTKDFFKQKEIQKQIERLMKSNLYKKLNKDE